MKEIPKTIHFCWFGKKPLPKTALQCIASWKKYCPDYRIIKWSEKNFNINCCDYMREAYEAGKWAFVSDVARLLIVYKYGGIYLDTDVELLASIESIRKGNEFFFAIEKASNQLRKEEDVWVNTGLGFGAIAGSKVLKAMIDEYEGVHFKTCEGYDLTTCPKRNTRALENYGFDRHNRKYRFHDGTIYPCDYFCPKEYDSKYTHFSKNTVAIHHFNASWIDPKLKRWLWLKRLFKRMFPRK